MYPLARARFRHLRGQFEVADRTTNRGAISWYIEARQPRITVAIRDENGNEKKIEKIVTVETIQNDEDVQRVLGIDKDRDGESFPQRIKKEQKRLAGSTTTAGYWLALAHFDRGNYSSASTWHQMSVELGIWADGTRYNLARAHEALGETEKARELYLATGDESPQRHGNLLRARMLKSKASKSPAQ